MANEPRAITLARGGRDDELLAAIGRILSQPGCRYASASHLVRSILLASDEIRQAMRQHTE